jgi:hypothetical protein
MTVTTQQHAFEQALSHDDDQLLLVALLRLIVAVEDTVHTAFQSIQTTESAGPADFYHDTIQKLVMYDILAYVSCSSAEATRELRQILASVASEMSVDWYQRAWSGRVTTALEIMGSIASALRTGMTIIYGHIHLLQQYMPLPPTPTQETTYQHILMTVDTLRTCRNQLGSRLAGKGIAIQPF